MADLELGEGYLGQLLARKEEEAGFEGRRLRGKEADARRKKKRNSSPCCAMELEAMIG